MKTRQDVWSLAEQLSAKSGINVEAVYAFLMWVGKTVKKNPTLIEWGAVQWNVYSVADPDRYNLVRLLPNH